MTNATGGFIRSINGLPFFMGAGNAANSEQMTIWPTDNDERWDRNVGINTRNQLPLAALDVRGYIYIDARNQFGDYTEPTEGGRIRFDPDFFGPPGGINDALIIEKTDDDDQAEGGIAFCFSTSTGGPNAPAYLPNGNRNPAWANNRRRVMVIRGDGNVGIGTGNPRYALDVIGNIRATGSVLYGGSEGDANGTAYIKPDYVFDKGHKVMTVNEVENYKYDKDGISGSRDNRKFTVTDY